MSAIIDIYAWTVNNEAIVCLAGLGNMKGTVMYSSQEGRAPIYVCGDLMAYVDREAFSVLVVENKPPSYVVKGTLKVSTSPTRHYLSLRLCHILQDVGNHGCPLFSALSQ